MNRHSHLTSNSRSSIRSTPRVALFRRLLPALGVLAALTAFAACSSAGSADSSHLSLTVTAPGDGASVGRSFPVDVQANVPFGAPSTGRHHLHLYFDGNKNVGEYTIVYGKHTTVKGLAPGRHTIEAEIANPDHSGTGVTQQLTVTVGAGAGAPATTPSTRTQPRTTAPDYGY
jgi:hypothetical protein